MDALIHQHLDERQRAELIRELDAIISYQRYRQEKRREKIMKILASDQADEQVIERPDQSVFFKDYVSDDEKEDLNVDEDLVEDLIERSPPQLVVLPTLLQPFTYAVYHSLFAYYEQQRAY
jgi:hypothetical protein